MAIFAVRLSRERKEISYVDIMGKFAGAVGNYNAHLVAYPDINWPHVAKEFVESLGLVFNPYVTQARISKLFYCVYIFFYYISTFMLLLVLFSLILYFVHTSSVD